MTPQFLRDEAARFRGMADTAQRESSKQRLLATATDYEARALDADELTEPNLGEAINVKIIIRPGKELEGPVSAERLPDDQRG